ncbi:hypothetical protein [Bacillus cereus]|uniref:Uncharacterized protein n=1 Tax=Bacillus cereus TaxID=1396 RepID=A0A161T424_BACCE|nr:hypothetical protein [Bacillus cereus]KZD63354.1 hypothetical protein B4088_3339 [Bacillus cereus]
MTVPKEEALAIATSILRRKAKRIEHSREHIFNLLSDIESSPSLDKEEKEWFAQQFRFVLENILINDDKQSTYWNS